MQTFTDINGRKWTVSITVGTVKHIKARLGLDILGNMEGFLKQIQDFIMLIDVLYVVCQEEAEKLGITEKQFGCSFAGPVIQEARNALLEAYAVFHPDPELTAKIRVIGEKFNAVGKKQIALLNKKMPQIERKFDDEVAAALEMIESEMDRDIERPIDRESMFGKLFPNSPESSE